MRFELDEQQGLLDQSLRGFLADKMPLDAVRKVASDKGGFDPLLYRGIAELGLSGLLVPEALGGSGLELLDAAVVAEALGHAAAPVPFAGAAVMAVLALRAAEDRAVADPYLAGIAAGDVRIGISCDPFLHGSVGLEYDGNSLSGTVPAVIDAAGATHFLIFLASGEAMLVDGSAREVECRIAPSLDMTRPLGSLSLSGAEATRISSPAEAASVLAAGRIMLAADIVGAGQFLTDEAVAYAKVRRQFGRVIGSFQGVKHMLADMVTMLEPCRALIWHAAHAQDVSDPESALLALQAKAHVGDVGREVARMAIEVHGGIGYTDLLGLHYWFKRCGYDRQILGGPEACRDEAARLQGFVEVRSSLGEACANVTSAAPLPERREGAGGQGHAGG